MHMGCRPQLAKLSASLGGWSLGAVLEQSPPKSRLEPEKWGSVGHGLANPSSRLTGQPRPTGSVSCWLTQRIPRKEREGKVTATVLCAFPPAERRGDEVGTGRRAVRLT